MSILKDIGKAALNALKDTPEVERAPDVDTDYETLDECIKAIGLEWAANHRGGSSLSIAKYACVKFPGPVSNAAFAYAEFWSEKTFNPMDIISAEKDAEKLLDVLKDLDSDKEHAPLLGIVFFKNFICGTMKKYKESWNKKSKDGEDLSDIISAIDNIAKILPGHWLSVQSAIDNADFIKAVCESLDEETLTVSMTAPKNCKLFIPKGYSPDYTLKVMNNMHKAGIFDAYARLISLLKENPKANKLKFNSSLSISMRFLCKPGFLFLAKYATIVIDLDSTKNTFTAKGKLALKEDVVPQDARNTKFWTVTANKGKVIYSLAYKLNKNDFDGKKSEFCSIVDEIKAECDALKKITDDLKEKK